MYSLRDITPHHTVGMRTLRHPGGTSYSCSASDSPPGTPTPAMRSAGAPALHVCTWRLAGTPSSEGTNAVAADTLASPATSVRRALHDTMQKSL